MSVIVMGFAGVLFFTYELYEPVNVGDNGSIKAIPQSAEAGQIVSYKINGCQDGKYRGITSVNIQSVDVPPSITVAVAAPSPQRIYCSNALLVPGQLPTGDYRLLILITYDINPVRNALSPVIRQYRSEVIHVTNKDIRYVLPAVKERPVKSTQPAATTSTASNSAATTSQQPAQTPQAAQPSARRSHEPKASQSAPQQPQPQSDIIDEAVDFVQNIVNSVAGR